MMLDSMGRALAGEDQLGEGCNYCKTGVKESSGAVTGWRDEGVKLGAVVQGILKSLHASSRYWL